jgi:hypothetical protein
MQGTSFKLTLSTRTSQSSSPPSPSQNSPSMIQVWMSSQTAAYLIQIARSYSQDDKSLLSDIFRYLQTLSMSSIIELCVMINPEQPHNSMIYVTRFLPSTSPKK